MTTDILMLIVIAMLGFKVFSLERRMFKVEYGLSHLKKTIIEVCDDVIEKIEKGKK